MVEYMPLPRAWKLALIAMQIAATGKLQLIIRRAERPMSKNFGLGLKIISSASGKNWNTANPRIISDKQLMQVNFSVRRIRSGFRAP